MEDNLYKKPLEELSQEQSWEALLQLWKRMEDDYSITMPKLMRKAMDFIITKGYNKKIYAINYGHPMIRMIAINKWPSNQAELQLIDRESQPVSNIKFSKDYLVIIDPKRPEGEGMREYREFDKKIKEIGFDEATKEMRKNYVDTRIKKEFNKSELEPVLDEFINKLLQER